MPEYIEKGKVINVLTAAGVADSDKRRRTWARAICKVDGISASDVAPVVHGEWEYDNNATDFGIGGYVCSKCKNRNNNLPLSRVKNVYMFAGSKFCPNCGAKMDGGEKDAEVQA